MLRFVLIAACAALASCATITRGTRTAFVVETIPAGARVRLSTGEECAATPCTFEDISRESEFTVTVSKPGYLTTTHEITHQMAGAGGAGMAGNVLIGGIVGAAIDANSGATQDLVPNPLLVTLIAEPTAVSAEQTTPADPSAAPVSN